MLLSTSTMVRTPPLKLLSLAVTLSSAAVLPVRLTIRLPGSPAFSEA